jgi:hypothetical protein
MSRYDGGRLRPASAPGYDRGFGRADPYGGDFRPHAGRGGGGREVRRDAGEVPGGFVPDGAPWEEGPLFGPARYGLGPYHRRLRERSRPDDELKREVEDALFYDTWVDADAIEVRVEDGVVTLRGDLPDYDEVRYATDDAWEVDGVRGVRSELRVDPARRKPVDHAGVAREPRRGEEDG